MELKSTSPIESQASTVTRKDFDLIGGGRSRSDRAVTGTVTFPDGLLHETITATSRDSRRLLNGVFEISILLEPSPANGKSRL